MLTFETLPVLLVSAATKPIAASVILDLVDLDVTAEYKNENDIDSTDRVWRLLNKYYSADVRVHALTDGEILTLNPHHVEAHIIHITEDEVRAGGAARAAARAGAGGAWARCGVRVLLADCAADAALRAWARAQRAEWAPRREPAPAAPPGAAAPFAETYGAERARAALHAHRWPARAESDRETESGSSSDAEGRGDDAEDEVRAVERAEAFAAALGALGTAGGGTGGLEGPERLARAEDLVLAFCRALGLDADCA